MSGQELRVCVIGAGAIGGFFAVRLARAGCRVSVLARGRTLEAIRSQGLRLHEPDGECVQADVTASDDAATLGPQDIVIIAVKSPSLASVARQLAPLLGPETVVLPALNGIPWWFFLQDGQPLAGHRLRSVDPDGVAEACIALARVVGVVVMASCSSPEPGVVRHASGEKVVFGEPTGVRSARADEIASLFARAGFQSMASDDIRAEIWTKLLGNACYNPVSLLTGAFTDDMIDEPNMHALFVSMVEETLALAARLGLALPLSASERIAATRRLGHVKTSMLQDVEAGRLVELDSILGAVVECAAAVGHPLPVANAVYALACMRARTLGLYPG